ncbi:hypothetical protein CFOL_v3_11090 [Cephalotus follicularis]|uniref:Putative plant transposon protein domain-containing protein n=1 Tax=Cephalotus follicularis TaxID=3775 RepID=A0A1Q3BI02_CEPFO|nr:hypothetical protein CFOL_v3_11090 [Cephalotus follicularis]
MASRKRKTTGARQANASARVDYDGDLFLSKENEDKYNFSLISVKLHNGKWLDRAVLTCNIASIRQWLKHLGWFDYLCSSHPIYPRIVKLFYANLEKTTTCVAKSYVLGVAVELTPEFIGETLGIPCTGITNFNDIARSDALKIFLERPNVNPIMTVTSSHLPIATRILLLLLTNTLLPKEGSDTLPSERDLKLIACIKNGTLVNLPYLIVKHILSRPNHLPYPMLLSRILATRDIDLSDEHNVKPKSKQLINKVGLKSCNIEFEDDQWVKIQAVGRAPVRAPDVDVEEEEEDDDDGDRIKVRPSGSGSGSGSSRPTMESLQAKMEYIQGRVDQIYDRLNSQDAQMAQVIQMLQNAYPQPPPPGSS